MQSYNYVIPGALSQDYWIVAKHVTRNMLENHVFWRLIPLLLLLQRSLLWLSVVWCKVTAKVNFARIWYITNRTPARRVTPPWTFTWQNLTPAERVNRSGRPDYPRWRVTLRIYHVNMIKLKWEIIWTGGLPHLPGVPHLHVNRPLVQFCTEVIA